MTWDRETRSQIGNALIIAQNALTGYWQLANAPETEEHQKMAQHALDVVREAIEAGGVLEEQGIVPDERWRRRILKMPRGCEPEGAA